MIRTVWLVLCCLLPAFAFELGQETVVAAATDSPQVRPAAEQLAIYLEKITGTKPERKIGQVLADQNAVILQIVAANELGDDGFQLRSRGERLFIRAQSGRGLLFGVFYFLDTYAGYKFLAKDFEYIPHYRRKSLGEIDDLQKPRFAYREIFFHEADDLLFSYKNLLNGRLGHRTLEEDDHLPDPIDTYTFMSSELMDKMFACNGQYDYANPRARQNALETLRKKLSEHDRDRLAYVTLEHEDRNSWCERGLKSGESPVVPFVTYTQFLASSLKKSFPNTLFFTQAYLWTRRAPDQLPAFGDNLGVHFSVIEADFSKPLTSKNNRAILEDLHSWKKYTDHAVVWHYMINFGGYLFPYPDLFALDADIKTFADDAMIKGLFLQGGGVGAELANLRVWVFAKLLWNPKRDLSELIATFCRYYYGDGADAVQRYIQTLQKMIEATHERLPLKTPIDAKYLSKTNLDRLDAILSEGLSKLKPDTPFYEHLLSLFAGPDYIRIMRGEANETIKKRFRNYLAKHPDARQIAEGVTMENLDRLIDLQRTRERVPAAAKGLEKGKAWLSFQEYQLELCCADIVEDHAASDGVAAMMPGSSEEWGFSLPFTNLPDGDWELYADVRIERNQRGLLSGLKWALRYGIDPGLVKGIRLSAQFGKGYNSIKIGTVHVPRDREKFVWLSPPGNDAIAKVYVDRIYLIRRK